MVMDSSDLLFFTQNEPSQVSDAALQLVQKFRERRAIIGIIGLGYVGLPLACAAAKAGFRVVGFDIDENKSILINQGRSYLETTEATTIAELVHSDLLKATSDFALINDVDVVIVCVPTPLTLHREPDLSYVERTARTILSNIRFGQLIVLESTTWPGTTTQIVRPILESTGLRSGVDFYLAFSPEREDPGNLEFSTSKIPKVVGGDGHEALGIANALYSSFVSQTITVSSADTAEAVKLTENIFRAVNIALVNELKIVYDAMGIDVWEVIDAAKTKPFGYMPFYPGPGLGGHCIPIDPFYLTWKAREFELSTKFIELAGEINTAMPNYVIDKLVRALDEFKKCGLNGTRVLIIGMAYKKNINDIRESPSLKLFEILEKRGANVDYYDPHVPVIPQTREHKDLSGRESLTWDVNEIAKYDAVLIATDHDCIDYRALVQHSDLVIDTRNACARRDLFAEHVIKA